MTESKPPEGTYLFLRRENEVRNGYLLVMVGLAAFGFAGIGFFIALLANLGHFSLHAITTLPTLFGIGALGLGLSAMRAPSQISVDVEGLVIVGRKESRRILWTEIGLASTSEAPLNQRRRLTLYDRRGKSLVTISDSYSEFEFFVDLVRQHVADNESVSEPLRIRKARRSAMLSAVFGVFLAVAASFIAYDTWSTARAKELLAAKGVEGEGKILRRFLAPNGITCRLEYQVEGDNHQTATRNAEVDPGVWAQLQNATTVPIRYLPAEPEISELVSGEVRSRDDLGPVAGYGLSAAGACMMLLAWGVAVMQWYGWDYGTDPKTGKLGFRKLGT